MRSKLKATFEMLQRDPQNGVVKEEQNKTYENMKGFEEKWINEFNMRFRIKWLKKRHTCFVATKKNCCLVSPNR